MRGYRVGVSSILSLLAVFLLFAAYVDVLTYLVSEPKQPRPPKRSVQFDNTSDTFTVPGNSNTNIKDKTDNAKEPLENIASEAAVKESGDEAFYKILQDAIRGNKTPVNNGDKTNKQSNIQEPKKQYPQIQEPKKQYPQIQEPKKQYPQIQDPKKQYPQIQEPKKQYPQIQDPKKQYPAKQVPAKQELKKQEPNKQKPSTGVQTDVDETTNNHDPPYIKHRKFTVSQNSTIYILGAVGKNTTAKAYWDRFAVYGQWYDHDSLKVWSLRCCNKYADGTIIERKVYEFYAKTYHKPGGQNINRAKLRIWHSTCKNPSKGPFPVPHWISIARNTSCLDPTVSYIKPYLTYKRPAGHLTITTKMAYAKIKPETVVSYLENARYLGINKVLTYVLDNLDPTVDRILRHYASTGLVDYNRLHLADLKRIPRSYPPLGAQYMNDEWLTMRDAIERNMGSEFFGIFDMDEYLLPSGNRTYKQMLRGLRQRFPDASHFFFTNIHFLTEFAEQDPPCAPNCSQFRRHFKTAPSKFDFNSIHEKMIIITSRVLTASIRNHYIESLKGYSVQQVPPDEGYVRHYGSCERKFSEKVCKHKKKWVEDKSMIQWAKDSIEDKILKKLKYFLE